jgi:hypothetical protein
VVVDVDEPRRDHETIRRDRPVRVGDGGAGSPDPCDPVARGRHGPGERRGARAVDDEGVSEQEVEHGSIVESVSAAGEEHREAAAATGSVFDPGATAVQLGEPAHQRQADADAG